MRVATLAVDRVDGRARSPLFEREGEDEEGRGALRGEGIGKGMTTESGLMSAEYEEVGGGAGAGSNGAKYEHSPASSAEKGENALVGDGEDGEKGENEVKVASFIEKEEPVGGNESTDGALAVGL